ncbi:lytic polysaccharide monooxygenase [Spirilliplanes yamanashiensis]|uniref:Chitin-binding type-3 domain-containing protein n=1 Tax=Spirilliplanes yamanashiensis TaxID=42233 RepID=A0A8J4DJS9_9ACTN|nr:lytic polysaccharide monooxygenase [Spirilliplanes yamanashiensis]MDP9817702.1 chitin-binding protein [Spirilliplanes yamanashiensis]GIJ04512.1 hypothetical protein Sya03_38640 [Spirilliplanes yamanashiensis]
MHVRRKLAAAGVAVAAAPLLAVIAPATPASAHGTMSDPPSRVYQCKNEGPESPDSDGCKAAVEAGGAAPFYDWNEVSLLDAGGRHRQVVPTGLCSAGRSKYRGLDLEGVEYKATPVKPGPLTVTYHASAPHASSQFTFYITNDKFDHLKKLNWNDLEQIANFDRQNPSTFTKWTIDLPKRTGRHILYTVWQRSVGSAEAFYSCSDIDFGGGTGTPPVTKPPTTPPTTRPTTPPVTQPTTPPTTAPTTAPTTKPPAGEGAWAPGVAYRLGQRVTYNGQAYTVRQAHTSLTGWEPPHVPALWLPA